MKQKKFYKTFKFWITSLLALSASSIITSLALTSCVVNDSANKSDIVINDQTQDQEISVDDTQSVTLTVEATSNKGEDLSYQWYVNKNTNNSTWTKIDGATNKTYTIPTSDLQSASGETTWQYKAEIYHNNDSTKKIESKPISVKIKPSAGDSKPNNPNPPENKPEFSPPESPDQKPDEPEKPSEPTPPIVPPSNDPNQPGIVPSPPHTPSQGIGARLPLDNVGIITTKYEQEKWVGDNSVSIAIIAKPNVSGIENAINNFISTIDNSSVKNLLNNLVGALKYSPDDATKYSQFGTGWILDYSEDKVNSNLKEYYIASNMHVLSSCFEYNYTSTVYPDGYSQRAVDVNVKIPFNQSTVSDLSVYISQPQYSLDNYKNNLNTYSDQWNDQWYKTDISINNWSDNLIPIGAYDSNYSIDKIPTSQAYDMELTYKYQDPPYNTLKPSVIYFESNKDNSYLINSSMINYEKYQSNIDDFSVFKISLENNSFDEKINKNDKYKNMFSKMKTMFNTNSNNNTNNSSSYISKLNKLLSILDNNYDKSQVDNLFMFGDYKNLTNLNTQISMGGYPLLSEGRGNNKKYYTTFNTNTLTGNNIIPYPTDKYGTRNNMGINQYTCKGNMYKVRWKDPGNFILKNVNLMPGSSGAIGIDQNYKLTCINWGTFLQIEYHQGIKYVLDSSSSTGIYSRTDKNSLVWKWVTYMKKEGKQTKLLELFNKLEGRDYFK